MVVAPVNRLPLPIIMGTARGRVNWQDETNAERVCSDVSRDHVDGCFAAPAYNVTNGTVAVFDSLRKVKSPSPGSGTATSMARVGLARRWM
jgi:hypothetical protein